CIELVFEYSATYVGAGNPEPLADCQLVAFEVVQLAQCVNGGVVPAGEREQRVAWPADVSLGLRAAPHDLNVAVAFRLTRSGRGRTAIAGVHGDLTNFAAAGRGEPGRLAWRCCQRGDGLGRGGNQQSGFRACRSL